MKASRVFDFWFNEADSSLWFSKDQDFDNLIRKRFLATHEAAVKLELYDWRDTGKGRLSEIIVIDQFSRNLFRDSPLAFAYDGIALALAQEAVKQGADKELKAEEKAFMYMPYMHSESPIIHDEAMRLFGQKGLEYHYEYEVAHKKIIDRFGRYPHRNKILGRESSAEEIEFLKEEGSSF